MLKFCFFACDWMMLHVGFSSFYFGEIDFAFEGKLINLKLIWVLK